MQTRKSIMELAQEVQRIKDSKADYIVAANKLEMLDDGGLSTASNHWDTNKWNTGPIAHEHIGQKLQIPKPYYDKMKDTAPALLAKNVNHWLQKSDSRHMLRTVGSTARALLSDRYRPLDNDMVLEAALPVLMEHRDFDVVSAEITDRRMYISVVSKKLTGEVKKGDVINYGMIISNSEVGAGSVRVEDYVYRLACLNGAIMATAMKKYHTGVRYDTSDFAFLSSEAIDYDNKAFMLRVRDTVRNSFSEISFQKTMEKMVASTGMMIEKKLDDFITDVTKRFDLSNGESDSLLKNLINGGDLSKWGFTNAMTAIANDSKDYDRAIDIQRIGGQLIDMDRKTWDSIAGGR
jgi:hypothetical protein